MTLYILIHYIINDSSKGMSQSRLAKIFSKALEMYLSIPGHTIEDPTPGGSTLLMQAARAGKKEIVKVLLQRGAQLNKTVFLFGMNKIRVLECLLASLNEAPEQKQSFLNTLLLEIVSLYPKNEYNATIAWLLKKGANPNCKNEKGQTPLVLAVQRGLFKRIKLLLKNKAIVNAQAIEAIPDNGSTIEIAQLLLQNKTYIEATSKCIAFLKHKIALQKKGTQLSFEPSNTTEGKTVHTYLFGDLTVLTDSIWKGKGEPLVWQSALIEDKRTQPDLQENQAGLQIPKKTKRTTDRSTGAKRCKR